MTKFENYCCSLSEFASIIEVTGHIIFWKEKCIKEIRWWFKDKSDIAQLGKQGMSHTFILLLILLSQLCTLLPKALKWISMLSTQLSRSHTYNFLYCLHFSLFLYSSVRLSLHLQAHAGVHHFRRMCVSVCVCVWKPIPVLTFHSPFLLDFGHTFIYTLAPPFFPVPLFLLILHSSLLTCHINYSHSIFSPYLLLRVLLLSSFFFSLTYTIPCSFFHFAPQCVVWTVIRHVAHG